MTWLYNPSKFPFWSLSFWQLLAWPPECISHACSSSQICFDGRGTYVWWLKIKFPTVTIPGTEGTAQSFIDKWWLMDHTPGTGTVYPTAPTFVKMDLTSTFAIGVELTSFTFVKNKRKLLRIRRREMFDWRLGVVVWAYAIDADR